MPEDTLAKCLIELLGSLHEAEAAARTDGLTTHPAHAAGARNLAAYVALRARDLRPLQQLLRTKGLASLEHDESAILSSLPAREAAGVLIARGDLALECGFERRAEVQEEILWLAEAAHLPVIWATQVLESLVTKGERSRAEMTDAARAIQAEA